MGEHLSWNLLTFQDIMERLTVYRYIYFDLVELRFAARKLENYLAYSVCSCARSQEIFD